MQCALDCGSMVHRGTVSEAPSMHEPCRTSRMSLAKAPVTVSLEVLLP